MMKSFRVIIFLGLFSWASLVFAGGNSGEGVGTRPKADFITGPRTSEQFDNFAAGSVGGDSFGYSPKKQNLEPAIPQSTPEFVVEGIRWVESNLNSDGIEEVQVLYKAKANQAAQVLKLKLPALESEVRTTLLKSKKNGGSWELLVNRKGTLQNNSFRDFQY